MDQRLFFWLNRPTRKALEVQITRLSYASWLRHTLRVAVLVRPSKLLKRRCKSQRSKAIPRCPTLSGMKSRCTNWVYLIIKTRGKFVLAKTYSTDRAHRLNKVRDNDEFRMTKSASAEAQGSEVRCFVISALPSVMSCSRDV